MCIHVYIPGESTKTHGVGRATQGRRSDGRARGSKGNARALRTDDEGSEPKITWIWGAPLEMFLRPHDFDWLKMLSRIF